MSMPRFTRRSLLQSTAAGAVLGWSTFPRSSAPAAEPSGTVKILEPIHGAVLNHRHGQQTTDGLVIRVSGSARPGDRVRLNGKPCRAEGNRFTGEVLLHEHETELVATSEGEAPQSEDRVRVVWDRYSRPRYRVSIDDSSFFLRDIAAKNYASLFDCFFLKLLRELHNKYGTKFTLNIYYAVADDAKFPTDSDFRLPQFPDRYRSEWKDNADWLKLAFHAYANMPSRPYEDAPPEKLLADLDLVAGEIHRFAGEATYAPPTVIHFGMTRQTALKPLFEHGVRTLSGYFVRSGDHWDINYNWDEGHSEYLSRHNAWKDFQSGIVFSRVSIVCNNTPVNRVEETLAPLAADPNTAEILDLFTHEQYFWPFYFQYVPDHAQRLETAIRWATEHGYQPVLFHEGFLGGRV